MNCILLYATYGDRYLRIECSEAIGSFQETVNHIVGLANKSFPIILYLYDNEVEERLLKTKQFKVWKLVYYLLVIGNLHACKKSR